MLYNIVVFVSVCVSLYVLLIDWSFSLKSLFSNTRLILSWMWKLWHSWLPFHLTCTVWKQSLDPREGIVGLWSFILAFLFLVDFFLVMPMKKCLNSSHKYDYIFVHQSYCQLESCIYLVLFGSWCHSDSIITLHGWWVGFLSGELKFCYWSKFKNFDWVV